MNRLLRKVMKMMMKVGVTGFLLGMAFTATFAGIKSKEAGALLIYPEYYATDPREGEGDSLKITYLTITNDKPTAVSAHMEVVDGEACNDCSFDLPLTGFETRRLALVRTNRFRGGWVTAVVKASDLIVDDFEEIIGDVIITACPGKKGFVVAALESFAAEPRTTLGENILHGDEVVVDLNYGTAAQVGAIAVQGLPANNGDRVYNFNDVEYKKLPSVVTAGFWAPTSNNNVDPRLVLFNVNFDTNDSIPPVTECSMEYVNAYEERFSRSFNFDCWTDERLAVVAPGTRDASLGSANGFLWIRCEEGTHGALYNSMDGATQPYPYSKGADFKDTPFQRLKNASSATLRLTKSAP